ncbi:lipocalin family protein [Aestuariibaculum sp. YM273]|uniref:lipocalin family protein n=1 Tax=Aestuariibaculum sp. YM273 TaxID=3070659 RepID=UPI0027DE292D|nr:lipocalin family protein [Aestuariibaculum sp. YM273]WMI65384.1 lipocalin family protein [Aestuariibaculum sp. YM273]
MRKPKLITVLLTTFTLCLISCSDSDEIDETAPFSSKWYLEKQTFNGVSNPLSDCEKQGYIEFNSDGTFERVYYYSSNGTDCLPEDTDIGTFKFDGAERIMTLTFTDTDEGEQVQKLNNFEMGVEKLTYTWDEDGDGTDDVSVEFIRENN